MICRMSILKVKIMIYLLLMDIEFLSNKTNQMDKINQNYKINNKIKNNYKNKINH